MWTTLGLAFQTLGVVYGDMGTSPLYVFTDVFSKVEIESEVDVLGALSLVMYTIALIPLAKYVFVVLKANDSGEGNPVISRFHIRRAQKKIDSMFFRGENRLKCPVVLCETS